MANPAPITVAKGQLWENNDPRFKGRQIQVERIDSRYAYCIALSSKRKTRIQLSRFRPIQSGYRLVQDSAGDDREVPLRKDEQR